MANKPTLTQAEVGSFIAALAEKVKTKQMDAAEAEKLAVFALQEVLPIEDTAAEEDQEPKEDTPAPSTPASSVDPKTKILSLMTDFEQSCSEAWNTLKHKLEETIKSTSGAAFPVGDFNTKSSGNNTGGVSIKIEQSRMNKEAVDIDFSFDRKWTLKDVQAPEQEAQASAEEACHLGLRRELLAIADDILNYTTSELSWKRAKVPNKTLAHLAKQGTDYNDPRVVAVSVSAPTESKKDEWKKWAVAAQAYLLGSDYAQNKSFDDVLGGI